MSEEAGGQEGNPGEQGGGGGGESWRDALPEVLREAPFIKAADSAETAFQQINDAASYVGNSIRVPSEEASDADRSAFYDKLMEKAPGLMLKPDLSNQEQADAFYKSLGRPDDADGYKFELEDGEEAPVDIQNFAAIAHKHGLNQTQFEGLVRDVIAGETEALEISQSEHNNDMRELWNEWGLSFDQNMGAVANFLRMTGAPDGLVEMVEDKEMSVEELRWFHSIANQTKSPQELLGQPKDQNVVAPKEAQARINEIMANQEHPYWNSSDPRNKDAIQEMIRLQKLANPSASTNVDDLR